MPAREMIRAEGAVEEMLPNRMYRVRLENDEVVLTTVAGRARRGLRILHGDRVTVEMSPYDLSRGRITGKSDETEGEKR
ncbi:MAG TPA: translation initiation factor IF-1 [Longimicrobiales bacterium]|nr:translation initiation factor IF-1 [Longimicrobiales bacterium]